MFLCLSFIASLVIHSVTRLSPWKSRASPNSIPNPIHLFCTSHSLNTTYFQKFRLVSSMDYLKFQIVCMREREELRALKSCQERKSSVPCSHNFLLPLHMSTILNLLSLISLHMVNSHDHWL
jgi:hypothetical protein